MRTYILCAAWLRNSKLVVFLHSAERLVCEFIMRRIPVLVENQHTPLERQGPSVLMVSEFIEQVASMSAGRFIVEMMHLSC